MTVSTSTLQAASGRRRSTVAGIDGDQTFYENILHSMYLKYYCIFSDSNLFVNPYRMTNMGWLRERLPSSSLSSVRVRNFERCIESTPGARIIDQRPTRNGEELTIRLTPGSSMSPELVKMLNTSRVTLHDISTEQEATYLEVRIT